MFPQTSIHQSCSVGKQKQNLACGQNPSKGKSLANSSAAFLCKLCPSICTIQSQLITCMKNFFQTKMTTILSSIDPDYIALTNCQQNMFSDHGLSLLISTLINQSVVLLLGKLCAVTIWEKDYSIISFTQDVTAVFLVSCLYFSAFSKMAGCRAELCQAIVWLAYLPKILMYYLLIGVKHPCNLVEVLSIIHTLPIVLSHYQSQKVPAPFIAFGAITFWGYQQALFISDSPFSADSSPNFSSCASVCSIIIFYWLENVTTSQLNQRELSRLQGDNQVYLTMINNNEVHVASLIHELRNPLNSLSGSVTLLEKSTMRKDQQQQELFQVAHSCCEHLNTLIGNLLEFSKLKAKKIELNKVSSDIRENSRAILKMSYFKAKEKKVKLQLFVSTNFPKKVIADEQRINQIIINLLANAIKFTEKGTVKVYLGWRFDFSSIWSVQDSQVKDCSPSNLSQQQLSYQEDKSLFSKLQNPQSQSSLTKNSEASLSIYESSFNKFHPLNRDRKVSEENYSPTIQRNVRSKRSLDVNGQLIRNDIGNLKDLNKPRHYQTDINNYFKEKCMLQKSSERLNLKVRFHKFGKHMQEFDAKSLDKKKFKQDGSDRANSSLSHQLDRNQAEPESLLAQDEIYSDSSVQSVKVKETFQHKPDYKNMHSEQVNQPNDLFGTPSRQRQLITETELDIIDRVVRKHKGAHQRRSSSLMSPMHVSTCDLDLILTSNRFNNLESSKKKLDSHYQPLKFIVAKNNSQRVASPEFNQSLQSESMLINQALQSFDDNKLLMKSLGYAKKHQYSQKHIKDFMMNKNVKYSHKQQQQSTSPKVSSLKQKNKSQNSHISIQSIVEEEKASSPNGAQESQFKQKGTPSLSPQLQPYKFSQEKQIFNYNPTQNSQSAITPQLTFDNDRSSGCTNKNVDQAFNEWSKNSNHQARENVCFNQCIRRLHEDSSSDNQLKEIKISFNADTIPKPESQKLEAVNDHPNTDEEEEASQNLNDDNSLIKESPQPTSNGRDSKQNIEPNSCKEISQMHKQSSFNLAMMKYQRSTSQLDQPAVSRNPPETSTASLVNEMPEKGFLEIRVVDSGIGISKEGISKLFKPYNQADKSIQKNFGGTGLGLCICNELVQIMNGNINVKSQLGHGTEFSVNIPMDISNELTTLIEEGDFELQMGDFDLLNYQFIICNNPTSFGIQQLKKRLLPMSSQFNLKTVDELLTITSQPSTNIFTKGFNSFVQDNTFKAFLIDHQIIKKVPQLLTSLSNCYDEQYVKQFQKMSSPKVDAQQVEVRIPIIILISPFMEESRLKRQDNIFVMREPIDNRSMKKMLVLLKIYYNNSLNNSFQKKSKVQSEQNGLSPKKTHKLTDLSVQDNYIRDGTGLLQIPQYQNRGRNSQSIIGNLDCLRITSNIDSPKLIQSYPMTRIQSGRFSSSKRNSNQKSNNSQISSQIFYVPSSQPKQVSNFAPQNKAPGLIANTTFGDASQYKEYITEEEKSDGEEPLCIDSGDKKILIVNDDQFSLRIMSMLVDSTMKEMKLNFSVVNAKNGKEAVDMFKAYSNIKLVLMDIQMPIMDGYEATVKIREFEEERNQNAIASHMSFIIGVSGFSSTQHFRKCQQAGMNESLTVPISQEKLNEVISKVFS